MNDIKEFLNSYDIKPIAYEKDKSAVIVRDKNNTFVVKKRNSNNKKLFELLRSRNYLYFPEVLNIDRDDKYDIYKYYDSLDVPLYEKCKDISELISLLHVKTTHYIDNLADDYKGIYEDLVKRIDELYSFFNELNRNIDEEIYMSPDHYLLARNITKIYSLIHFCANELDLWYEVIKDKTKVRVCLNHNNLDLDNILNNEHPFLISWDKSCYDSPVNELYKFYKNCYKDVDFLDLFRIYESRYPLLVEEKKLFFIKISLPDEIKFTDDSYLNIKILNEYFNYISKTDSFISKYYSK